MESFRNGVKWKTRFLFVGYLLAMGAGIFGDGVREDTPSISFPGFKDKVLGKIVSDHVRNSGEEAIEYLVAENANIRNLSGIEAMQSLQVLSLAGNYIEDVTPLAKLGNLKKLNLSHNHIEHSTALIRLPLESLDLSFNRIEYAFSLHFDKLVELNISHNKIQQLVGNFSQLGTLRYLNVSHNPIHFIPKKFECPALEILDFGATKIADLTPLLGLKELNILAVKNCPFLRSIEPLFLDTPMGLLCRLPVFRQLDVDVSPLNPASQKMVKQLMEYGCNQFFKINGVASGHPSREPLEGKKEPRIFIQSTEKLPTEP
jgi:Leucine-rich repeat (LRR) protein